jgi:hypothetical protein
MTANTEVVREYLSLLKEVADLVRELKHARRRPEVRS